MPIAMDPNQRHRVVLKSDDDKTPQPAFLYPYLTGRQQKQMMQVYESINDGEAVGSQNMDKAFTLATMFLKGWEHITHPESGDPVPFDPSRLDEICSVVEAMELAQRVLFGQSPEVEDKKKLESLLESDTEKSAKSVPA